VALAAALGLSAHPAAAQAPNVQGLWRSGDTTIRITVQGKEARGQFVEIGDTARNLGFKSTDTSFVAAVRDNYLTGSEVIRYGATCHPQGRQVPMIGRLTADGQSLALHYYAVEIDKSCRDTGVYNVQESLWQRVPGR
jgi:hypothetical protein